MNKVLTPEFIQALGAAVLVLLISVLPQFSAQWQQIVPAIVAILIALLTAQLAGRAVNSYYAVKSQELEFRYLGQKAVSAENADLNYHPIDRT